MSEIFDIKPLDESGEPEQNAEVWYVMEGPFIHCTCPSPNDAKLALKYVKDKDISNAALKNIRFAEEQYEISETIFRIQSELAREALDELERQQLYDSVFAKDEESVNANDQISPGQKNVTNSKNKS